MQWMRWRSAIVYANYVVIGRFPKWLKEFIAENPPCEIMRPV